MNPDDFMEQIRRHRAERAFDMAIREQEARMAAAQAAYDGIAHDDIAEPRDNRIKPRMKTKKDRHFNDIERAEMHKPESDWEECGRGEKCVNASSLDVSDIIKKHKLVTEVAQ